MRLHWFSLQEKELASLKNEREYVYANQPVSTPRLFLIRNSPLRRPSFTQNTIQFRICGFKKIWQNPRILHLIRPSFGRSHLTENSQVLSLDCRKVAKRPKLSERCRFECRSCSNCQKINGVGPEGIRYWLDVLEKVGNSSELIEELDSDYDERGKRGFQSPNTLAILPVPLQV